MEESDKTTALKKAYAEIILNTAKESAARVMVSDRKSAQFHHDLCGTKEEALRLLVRLKQMIDAKTIETEITSSNQQQQIDVLEAQLQEAEDIITDLRTELRWVRDKLEKAKVNERQTRNVVNKEEETTSAQKADLEVVVESFHPNQEVADTCLGDSLLYPSLLRDDEYGKDESQFGELKGCDACESELNANIISKKLELSRNGCTQRIHALERKVMDMKSSPSANEEEQGTTKEDSEEILSSGKVNEHESSTCRNTRCLVLGLRSRNAEVITKPLNALGIKKTSKSRKLLGRRKRRWGKRKATSVRPQSQLIKPCQSQSDLPCSITSIENSDGEDSMETHLSVDPLNTCKELEKHLQHKRTLYNGDISILRRGKRSKTTKTSASISSPVNPTEHLVESCQESSLLVSNKADIQESETKLKPLLHSDSTEIEKNVDQISESTNVTVFSMGSELVNLQSDSKVTTEVSNQIRETTKTDVNRLVKYTFQRKRKKKEVEEKENNGQDQTETTLSNETSSGTPGLAELATQLITLSEN